MENRTQALPGPFARFAILFGSALVLWFAFFWINAPSERFNAILVPLWVLNFFLSGRKLDPKMIVVGAGFGIGVLAFNLIGSYQAVQMGARLAWTEPFQKFYFTAGLFVLYGMLCSVLNALIALIPAARELLVAPRGWWLRTLRTGIAISIFAPFIFVSFNIHRFKYASNADPMSVCKLPFQAVSFATDDGENLQGWFVPRQNSSKTIVVVHGVGSNRGDSLTVLPFLHKGGFNVFLFDLRGHGDSSGHTISFGVNEGHDVAAAVHWAKQQPGGQKVGVLAYSMGASSALHAVGENGLPEANALVLDSTFSEFAPLVKGQTNFLPAGAANASLKVLDFYTRLELGFGLDSISPGQYIDKISPRPVLIIHGTSDTLIPPSQARQNFARAKQPKQIYWIEKAWHCAGYQVDGAKYEKTVVAFFNESLN
ncbi:alpha/beta fold hydrolase [bacterium]|nr:MAG: alpha/beta fold hydrolase [bacterium]